MVKYMTFFLSVSIPRLGLWLGIFLMTACVSNHIGPPEHRVYIPKYIPFTYKVNDQVQVSHEYLFGPGARKCRYVGRLDKPYMEGGELLYPYKTPEIDDFFEVDGHVYQGGLDVDKKILGYPSTSRLGGEVDPETGNQKMYVVPIRRFTPLCASRIGSSEYIIFLKKTSALSIAQAIENLQKVLGGAWKNVATWESPRTVERGGNTWTVFNYWNKGDYLSDASENWFLPLGDKKYYFQIVFMYKSAMRERGDPAYLKSREMFDHIIDSFHVRDLTAEEKAAIIHPPIITPPRQAAHKPTK